MKLNNMVTKTFINNCLYFLNKVGYKYNNVSYSVTRFNNFVATSFHIWDSNRNRIIKTFLENIDNSNSFENMKSNLNQFIEENKELLC